MNFRYIIYGNGKWNEKHATRRSCASKAGEFSRATPQQPICYLLGLNIALGNILETYEQDPDLDPQPNINTIWDRGRKSVVQEWEFSAPGSVPTGVLKNIRLPQDSMFEHNEFIARHPAKIDCSEFF
jgi:hypothetical protein